MIKFIKEKRNLVLSKQIINVTLSTINKQKNKDKIVIMDIGSGKQCWLNQKFNNNLKLSSKYSFHNYEFFSKKEIYHFKKLGFNCYNIKESKKLKKSDILIFNDVLHHIFYQKIDYNKVGKFLVKLLKTTKYIFIKDHFSESNFDLIILNLMDKIGNKDIKDKVTNNYFQKKKFLKMCLKYKINIKNLKTNIEYYPKIIPFFGKPTLHFSLVLESAQ